MSRARTRERVAPGLALAVGLLAASCPAAWGDEIMLRGGGEIQGKVIADPKTPRTVQVLLLRGGKPLSLQKGQILEVVPRPSPLDDYVVKKGRLAATAQSEYELGLWCEGKGLADLARTHFEAALVREGSFEPAHKKLGHVLHDGQWLSPDDLRQEQGLVKFRGQWITPEEKEKREASAQAAAAQAGWLRRIRLLRQAILAASEDRRREAESELMHIQEPQAIAPLVKALGKDPTPLRLLLVQVLGQIPGKESSRALVHLLLAEPEDEVRTAAVDRLKERDEPEIGRQFVQSLRSKDVRVVNRSAWALGQLGLVLAVPRLVGALVSTEERLILVPADGEAAASGPGGLPGPVLMGMNQSYAAYMTGPAMAPNAVGYGATSVPMIGGTPLGGGTYLGMGAAPNRGPQPRYVTYTYQNLEVRNALQKLTGQDFGYDDAAWRRWIKTSFNPNPTPVRQVPQP
jgi:hypothetical protein